MADQSPNARSHGRWRTRAISPLSRSHLIHLLLALATVFMVLPASVPTAFAATLPSHFTEQHLTAGCTYPYCLSRPTAMALSPDGALFVAEQSGRLRIIRDDVFLTTPFVDLAAVTDPSNERGLLGIAIDPQFATNPARRYVYVYYTVKGSTGVAAHNRISRFTAQVGTHEAVPGSEKILMDLDDLSGAGNHNGGAMHFANDGTLFVAVGENANSSNAQSLNNRLGKILRIHPDGSIPTDNPFYNVASGANRSIWALGLRNPFTFAIQRTTNRIFINDVGQSNWEEINEGVAGANFGWPQREGFCVANSTTDCGPPPSGMTNPRYAYGHSGSGVTGCSITGAAFYNPTNVQFPADYVGDYFFGDYCGGWIKRFDHGTGGVANFSSGITFLVDLLVAPDGSLYYLARNGGSTPGGVYRIRYSSGGQSPTITNHPANLTVAVGQSATFDVVAMGSPAPNYQWQRNGIDIPGATDDSYTLAAVAAGDDGASFRVIVSNSGGTVTSAAAILTVTSNQPPTATITAPAVGTRYTAGQPIVFAGAGTDAKDGVLPASAFTWQVDLHHDSHIHPALPATGNVTTGQYMVPPSGHIETTIFYRIRLTVRDSGGLTHTTTRDIAPRTARMTFATNPAGLSLTLDGQAITAPQAIVGVAGVARTVGAPSPQVVGSNIYTFATWSDGGAATHSISTLASDTAYTATFRLASGLVFNDANRSGVREANEVGLADATVFVDRDGSGDLDASEPRAISDSGGAYLIPSLSDGVHRLCALPATSRAATTPRCSWLTVAGGVGAFNLDFGSLARPTSCPVGVLVDTVRTIAPMGSANYVLPTNLTRTGTTGAWPNTRLTVQPWSVNPATSVQRDEQVAYALTMSDVSASAQPALVLRFAYGKGRQQVISVVAADGTVATLVGNGYSLPSPLPVGFSIFDKNGELHIFGLPVDGRGVYQDLFIQVRILASSGTTSTVLSAAGKVVSGRLVSISGLCSDTAQTIVFTGPTDLVPEAAPVNDVAVLPF